MKIVVINNNDGSTLVVENENESQETITISLMKDDKTGVQMELFKEELDRLKRALNGI